MEGRQKSLTLFELNSWVRNTLETHLSDSVWLQAELSEVRESRGHCYLAFVQKAADGNELVASASGVIWKSNWNIIRPYFERVTGRHLCAGMQVLVQVGVSFHELYGYKLIVTDIDPVYTIGDLARRRQEIMLRLEEEGVINMNREQPLPRLIRRVAVISSPSAAGWGDFRNQLLKNGFGFTFDVTLFQATMQGGDVESSIIGALNQIAGNLENWDVVVIIRGGGAAADLSGFDSLSLAENVAQFPLPIITGIGHERDDTVIDMVAHTRVKTPTAAAEFILSHQLGEWNLLCDLADRLNGGVEQYLVRERSRQDRVVLRMRMAAPQLVERYRHRLDMFQQKIDDASPERLLKLGFSIARIGGKAVRSISQLSKDDVLEITFSDGKVESRIEKI